MMNKSIWLVMLASVFLVACSDNSAQSKSVNSVSHDRWYNQSMVKQGKELFQQNCAQCHGAFGQGNSDWRQPTAEGRYLPPPLNGTGHTWHHPLNQLRDVIKNGRGPDVPSDMPAWGNTLDDEEIDAIIAWFQSRWPDEIYQAWNRSRH